MIDDICALVMHRNGHFLAGCNVVPGTQVVNKNLNIRIDRLRARSQTSGIHVAIVNIKGRDKADNIALGHHSGHHTDHIAQFVFTPGIAGDIITIDFRIDEHKFLIRVVGRNGFHAAALAVAKRNDQRIFAGFRIAAQQRLIFCRIHWF